MSAPRRTERGAVVLLLPVLAVATMLGLVGLARLAAATHAQARADTAADAAALAAADALALGDGVARAERAAAEVAAANGGRLTECACAGRTAEVVVEVDAVSVPGAAFAVRGRARAEVVLPTG